ncbi:MAG: AAA family ATPase [Gammaproteobacteria bacterium]|nr:AAA family ATPase [Gammaproteobacteria bacterium]
MALKKITSETTNRMTCLVIGASGVGKTSLLRTIPEGENALVVSAESGLLCVRDLVESKRINGFEINHFEDIREVFSIVTKEEYTRNYKWLFVDSLTEIADICADLMRSIYTNPSDALKMWGDYNTKMKAMIKAFRDMQHYNVVFTCLEAVDSDDSGRRFMSPKIQGKAFKGSLSSLFDEVFYMTIDKDENGNNVRRFVTQPIDKLPAKDRSGKLEVFEVPDLSIITEKIMTKSINLNSSKMMENNND